MFPSDSDLETQFTFESSSQPLPEEPPFNLLLLGDWSGKNGTLISDLGLKRPIFIDRDNFDEVMSKLNVSLNLDLNNDGENILSLKFDELDDFHPDKIFQQVSLFEHLRDLRRRLLNEKSFDEAAREVRSWFPDAYSTGENKEEVVSSLKIENSQNNSDNLLDNILNQSEGNSSGKSVQVTHYSELSRFLNKIVSPHLIQTDENELVKLLQIIDDATGDLMRSILHHPKFQALESAWRGIYLIVRKVETDVNLKIFLLDLSKDELIINLKSSDNLADTEVYKWLIKDTIETPGGEPWAAVCGNYTFNLNVDDIALLIRVAKLSQTAYAPFIAHISPEMFGFSSFSETPNLSAWNIASDSSESKLWSALRNIPESRFLGLAMPKFLARLPYGKATDPTETFSFEEFKEATEHNNYLWGNPSFICGLLLAQTFRKNGWEMSRNFQLSLSDMPTHIYQEDGETRTKPCAEILMTDDICQKLFDEGFMPLISFKNTDRVQLGRFQSVSYPLSVLTGRWK